MTEGLPSALNALSQSRLRELCTECSVALVLSGSGAQGLCPAGEGRHRAVAPPGAWAPVLLPFRHRQVCRTLSAHLPVVSHPPVLFCRS